MVIHSIAGQVSTANGIYHNPANLVKQDSFIGKGGTAADIYSSKQSDVTGQGTWYSYWAKTVQLLVHLYTGLKKNTEGVDLLIAPHFR